MTTIGRNTRVNGRVEGDADVVVHGRVDGTIVLSQTLTVAPDGFVTGEVDARIIVIEGCAAGTFRASEVIHLTATAQVEGELHGAAVRLDPGARLRGRVEMDVDAPAPVRATAPAAVRPRTATAEPVRPQPRVETRTESVARTQPPRRSETPRGPVRTQPTRTQPASTAVTRAPIASQPSVARPRVERTPAVRPEPVQPEPRTERIQPEARVERAQPAAEPVVERPQATERVRTERAPREAQNRSTASPARAPQASSPTRAATTTTIDADELTVKELREMLTERGLPLSGTKSELVRRLQTGE